MAVWQTGDPSDPDNFSPYQYGPHLHNTMYHWDPEISVPGGAAWVLFRYGGGFRTGNAGFSAPAFFSNMAAETTFPVHMFSIDCREAQQQWDQRQFSRQKLQCYPSTIEDGVDDVNLAFQWLVENADSLGLNPELGGMAGTSSGAITSHGAMFLPEPARFRGFDQYRFPHQVRPKFFAGAQVPWNPLWMRGSTGMDYAFVETAHDPANSTDQERDDAYEALGNRLQPYNSYDNVLTAGYQPYICSLYPTNEFGAFPQDFQLADPHDARHGYYMHQRLAQELGYSLDRHKFIVTGGSYGASDPWVELNSTTGASYASQWTWVKDTIRTLAGGTYP